MSEQEILQWVISQYDVREEEWRPIDGYEGLYEISSHGRVKSLKGKKEMILKQRVKVQGRLHKQTYRHVILYGKYGGKDLYVHMLVAKAFLDNPENKPCIDHICGTDGGDAVWNLRWCTHKENNSFPLSRKHNSSSHKLTPVSQYAKTGEFVKTFNSIKEASICSGLFHSSISQCCSGKIKSSGGFIWKFANKINY